MEKTSFDPGTIVLQYLNDGARFVGVVVGNGREELLKGDDRKYFNQTTDHVCLVLSPIHNDYRHTESLFHEPGSKFPSYIKARRSCATPCDFKEELDLLMAHRKERPRGLIDGTKLRGRIFGFNASQREILCLVMLVKHYLSGQTLADWMENPELNDAADLYGIDTKTVFSVLQIVFPRNP